MTRDGPVSARKEPLGPGWQGLGFGGAQELTKVATGDVILTASNGGHSIFNREGPGFASPPGDAGLTLKEESPSVFALSDEHGDLTRFTVPEGGSGSVLTPSSSEEPGHPGALTYKFRTVGGVTEPTEALAPPPPGVSCQTLVKGCRALTFTYATSTTASGEAPSEWGEYAGRLATIDFTAYDPAAEKMRTSAVAAYQYDRQGRLRAGGPADRSRDRLRQSVSGTQDDIRVRQRRSHHGRDPAGPTAVAVALRHERRRSVLGPVVVGYPPAGFDTAHADRRAGEHRSPEALDEQPQPW